MPPCYVWKRVNPAQSHISVFRLFCATGLPRRPHLQFSAFQLPGFLLSALISAFCFVNFYFFFGCFLPSKFLLLFFAFACNFCRRWRPVLNTLREHSEGSHAPRLHRRPACRAARHRLVRGTWLANGSALGENVSRPDGDENVYTAGRFRPYWGRQKRPPNR
jgi:hypothetical protein